SPDEAYPLLARALLAEGQFSRVVVEGGRQLGSAQARMDMGSSVALAQLALGDVKMARAEIDAALAGLPGDARALTVQAPVARASNDFPAALKFIDQALAIAPKDSAALVVKAQLEAAAGQRDQAIKTLETAVEANPGPSFTNARLALISMLVVTGQADKAVPHVDALKKIAPKQFATSYADALVSLSRGDAAHARDAIQPVLGAMPDHLPSLFLYGLSNYELNSYAAAEEALSKVVAQSPNDLWARRALAATYLKTGRPTLALDTIAS